MAASSANNEVDGGVVWSQKRTGSRLDGGDVDGLRLQQGCRLACRILRHLHHLLLLLRGHGGCQRPRLPLCLLRANGAARAG
jgi:hypothetical protein